MTHCSGHCVVTEYRQTVIELTTWSGTTDDGRNVGAPINKKWNYYPGWLKAVKAGLEDYWTDDDDCDDDCDCDTDKNKPGPWQQASNTRKFRQPVSFPGYTSFYIHCTYTLEWRFIDGVCLGDPDEEEEGSMLVVWAGDVEAMAQESGAAAALKTPKRPKVSKPG